MMEWRQAPCMTTDQAVEFIETLIRQGMENAKTDPDQRMVDSFVDHCELALQIIKEDLHNGSQHYTGLRK